MTVPLVDDTRAVLVLTGESTRPGRLLLDALRARGVLVMLARHDFQARYRSTILGLAWSVLLPLVQGGVLAVVFTRVVRIQTGVSYPMFVLSGTTIWSYLSQSILAGSTSLVDRSDLATKIYFPRLLLPAVPTVAGLVSVAASTSVALVLIPAFGIPGRVTLLLLPGAIALTAVLATAVAENCALLHAYFRDVRYLVQAALLIGIYATPVIYPLSRAHHLRSYLEANPATGVLQLTRFCFFGRAPGGLVTPLLWTAGWIAGLGIVALLAYARRERVACDRL
jgi:lipopolysaccharide transport system permease protein